MTPSMRQSQYIDRSMSEAEITGDESSSTSHNNSDGSKLRRRAQSSEVGEDSEFGELAEFRRNGRVSGLSVGSFLTRSPLDGDPIHPSILQPYPTRFLRVSGIVWMGGRRS